MSDISLRACTLANGEASPSSSQAGSRYRRLVVVFDPRSLTREGMVKLLESAGALRVIALAEADQLALSSQESTKVDVVILNLGAQDIFSERARGYVTALQCTLPNAPLIFISDHDDRSHVCEALSLGVKGYVSTSLTLQILLAALRVVEAGGVFVPATAVTDESGAGEHPETPPRRTVEAELLAETPEISSNGLTQRQRQVLALLRKGKPNKLIAYELSMRESTVKVHVRQIMRKMNASNRTEAALIACSSLAEH